MQWQQRLGVSVAGNAQPVKQPAVPDGVQAAETTPDRSAMEVDTSGPAAATAATDMLTTVVGMGIPAGVDPVASIKDALIDRYSGQGPALKEAQPAHSPVWL